MSKQDLMKLKLVGLKHDLKRNSSLANAQATISALFMSDAILDCNADEYDQLGLDNSIRDEESSEDQAIAHMNDDTDDKINEADDKRILKNVRKSNCEWFVQCESVDASLAITVINGLIGNEIGSDTYGQIEDDANINFELYRQEAYQKFTSHKLMEI